MSQQNNVRSGDSLSQITLQKIEAAHILLASLVQVIVEETNTLQLEKKYLLLIMWV